MRPSMHLKSILSDSETALDDNWMISYIDVFVLMTTLFVLLLFLNRANLGNGVHEQLLQMPAQSEQAPSAAERSHEDLIAELTALPAPAAGRVAVEETYTSETAAELSLEQALAQSILEHQLDGHVQLYHDADSTELEIESRVLFNSAESELTRSGIAVLENLLPVLKRSEGVIFIEGHTDDEPIETARFQSNWDLAAARATEVLQFFVLEGMDKSRFRAVSYGDTKPLVPNSSEQNRRKNRRVGLVIQKG